MRLPRQDEAGAVAVLAGIMFASLFLVCAMVVQLGFSRDVRRQSQNASDASALAAASVVYSHGSAPDLASAVTVAITYAQKNFDVAPSAWTACTDPGRPAGWFSPSTPCISFDNQTKPTQVRMYMPVRETVTSVGAGAGVKSLPVGSVAVASLSKTSAMRPWGVCSEQLPATADSTVTMVFMPGNGHESAHGCSATNAGGDWWLMLCPEDGNGGGPTTSENIREGCVDPVSPVPNQPTDNTVASFLKSACSGRSDHCLGGDSGRNLQTFADDWQSLVGQTIVMPVFCDQPACSTSTVTGNGVNALYPVWKMVSVEVCGFRLGNRKSTDWPGTPDPCTTKNSGGLSPGSFGNHEDGLLLVFRTLDKPLDPSTDPTQKPWLVK